MAQLTGYGMLSGQDLYSSSATPVNGVGTLVVDRLGRKFRYVQNGGVALVVGNLLQAPARDTQFLLQIVSILPHLQQDLQCISESKIQARRNTKNIVIHVELMMHPNESTK